MLALKRYRLPQALPDEKRGAFLPIPRSKIEPRETRKQFSSMAYQELITSAYQLDIILLYI